MIAVFTERSTSHPRTHLVLFIPQQKFMQPKNGQARLYRRLSTTLAVPTDDVTVTDMLSSPKVDVARCPSLDDKHVRMPYSLDDGR